ncbi:hypothetical protein RND15_48450, partial [Streptomyces sp. DSM 41529]|nr:hypothetical protein [Streptomyces sp. DSM 41529]
GGVLFTGAVRLPTGEQYEWQYGALTGALLDGEGGDDASASADSLAALGHPVRLRLLREILGGRRTAAELAALDAGYTYGLLWVAAVAVLVGVAALFIGYTSEQVAHAQDVKEAIDAGEIEVD